jgi:large subunit ribosomal protein L7e
VPENVQKKNARDAKLLKELKESRDKAKKERV